MSRKLTTEEFIKRAKEVHGDKYDYSESVYIGYEDDIKIICPIHGEFSQTPSNHLKGKGCRKCGRISLSKQKHIPFEKFLEEARAVHGDKYEYYVDTYKNRRDNMSIRCKKHDFIFQQSPMTHLRGAGCSKCADRYIPTTQEFIDKAILVHGDKYSYDRVTYINAKTPIEIYCKKHQVYFNQTPDAHLVGKGCKLCAKDAIGVSHKHTTESYIEFVRGIHGDKYDYTNTVYASMNSNITVMCRRHNTPFTLTALQHKTGKGCPLCKSEDFVHHNFCDTEMFIKKAVEKHGTERYKYDRVDYRGAHTKVDIFCTRHEAYFKQTPHNHLSGNGCPICHNSKSALEIIKLLNHYTIPYEREFRFEDCRDAKPMPFDFVLFNTDKTIRCIIEYDGEQHYIEKPDWGGKEALEINQLHDRMKDMYCMMHHIPIIRIPYWEKKNITPILIKELNL